jgi:capsular exopolysaccharide synthesis family protein
MSKYTKALDKDEDVEKMSSKKSLKLPPTDDLRESLSFWERGVTVLKNTDAHNHIVTLNFPNSVLAEQYRMLRTSLKAQFIKEGAKVILVSSSIHGEGKTVTSTNLAVSLAEDEDIKIALIDADLRRGKIADYLGFDKKRPGLSHFLTSEMDPKQVMVRNAIPNLLVIPRGEVMKKPSELVSSRKFHYLVKELRTHFDYIIIDAPPIMSVADASILAREADGVLFVIQAGRTPKTVVAHAQLLFKQAGIKLFGYVMTNVEFQSADYRYYNYNYEESSAQLSFREMALFHLKEVGRNFREFEQKFNEWWQKKVLKNPPKKSAHNP